MITKESKSPEVAFPNVVLHKYSVVAITKETNLNKNRK